MQQRETTDAVRLVLSSGALVLRSVRLDKPELTIGRRPYNDIQLDDLTVSGEHAVVRKQDDGHALIDLHSRNGTLVNGVRVRDHRLRHGDRIAIGVYRISFLTDGVISDPGLAAFGRPRFPVIEMMNGPQAGHRMVLDRPIMSLGRSGSQVAVVARRADAYTITHLEGPSFPLVNGESIGLVPRALAADDLIELGGTIMRFRSGA